MSDGYGLVTVITEGRTAWVSFARPVTRDRVQEVIRTLETIDADEVIVDCRNFSNSYSTTSYGALVGLRSRVPRVVLENTSPMMREHFALLNSDELFEIKDG